MPSVDVKGLDIHAPLAYYVLVAVLFLVALWVMKRIVESPLGKILQSIRENALRAEARNATKGMSIFSALPTIATPAFWTNLAAGNITNPLHSPMHAAEEEQARANSIADSIHVIRQSVQAEQDRIAATRQLGVFGETATATTEQLADAFGRLTTAGRKACKEGTRVQQTAEQSLLRKLSAAESRQLAGLLTKITGR